MLYDSLSDLVIRKYKESDRESIRKICCDTAFMGEPVEKFFDDREIVADFLTSYYTDYEPESTFVVESKGEVIGYLTGCKNIKREKRIFITRILPKVLLKFFSRRFILIPKTRKFVFNYFKSFLKGELNHPDFSEDYPASLHINIDYKFRNRGIGGKLIKNYLDYLKQEKIKGIHLSTVSSKAKDFFTKVRFIVLYCRNVSYYRYLGKRNLSISILGKKLN